MKEKDRQEVNDIVRNLNAIIRELDSLSNDIAGEFKGIGSSYCSRGIKVLSERYGYVRNELNKIK